MNFSEIWSVISTVFSVLLFGWDIYLLGESKKQKEVSNKEKEIHKSQVKIWQHYANGISNSILNLSQDKFSSNSDLQLSIKVLQPVSYYLYKSLNEERLFTDEEVKQEQLETSKKFNSLLLTNKENVVQNP